MISNWGGRTRLVLAALFVGLLCGSTTLVAQSPAESTRFLFIIDTSASMKPLENAVQESLFDLVYSGVRGHMTNGDTYGIWVVNDQNDTSFKMETWKQRHAVEIAAKAAKHVKDRGFKGTAKLAEAVADAAVVIKNVGDLKIVLISNGETPISGTPFDDVINVRFRELAPQLKNARATLNTTLIAQDGNIVAWAANSPEFLIEVPYVAPKPKAKIAVAQSITSTSAVARAVATTNVTQPAKPRPAVAPIIITQESVAKEKRIYQSMISTVSNEPVAPTNVTAPLLSTTSAVAVAVSSNITETTSAVGGKTTPEPATIVTAATVTNNPAKPALIETTEATNVAAVSAVPFPSPRIDAAAESTPVTNFLSPVWWIAIGAATAFAAAGAAFLIFRGRRQQPSLISQSFAHQRVRTS